MKIFQTRITSKYAILSAIAILSFSCTPRNDYTKEIILLDSASLKLKEAEIAINNLDTNSLKVAYSFATGKLHYISEKITHDTLTKATAVILNDAFLQTKSIGNLLDNIKFLNKAVAEGYKRIGDLKHDLEKDLIEKNLSDGYIKNEINSSDKLNDLITTSITRARIAAVKLDSLKTKITLLADSLASK